MSNLKTHFAVSSRGSVCGRGRRTTDRFSYVDCLSCKAQPEFTATVEAYKIWLEAEFAAQTPHTIVPQFGRVNDDGVMECRKCQGVLWRERPRSLWSFHYVCEGCGTSVHPLTETGMST